MKEFAFQNAAFDAVTFVADAEKKLAAAVTVYNDAVAAAPSTSYTPAVTAIAAAEKTLAAAAREMNAALFNAALFNAAEAVCMNADEMNAAEAVMWCRRRPAVRIKKDAKSRRAAVEKTERETTLAEVMTADEAAPCIAVARLAAFLVMKGEVQYAENILQYADNGKPLSEAVRKEVNGLHGKATTAREVMEKLRKVVRNLSAGEISVPKSAKWFAYLGNAVARPARDNAARIAIVSDAEVLKAFTAFVLYAADIAAPSVAVTPVVIAEAKYEAEVKKADAAEAAARRAEARKAEKDAEAREARRNAAEAAEAGAAARKAEAEAENIRLIEAGLDEVDC